MTVERKVIAFEQAAVDPKTGEGRGYGAVFGNRDDGGDIIQPGFFEPVIPDFLREGFISWGHDWYDPVAMPLTAAEDARGLDITWQFHSTPAAQEKRTITAERLNAGKTMGLSIGYEVADEEVTDAGRLLKKAKRLFEVGLVLVPMNRQAQVTEVKSAFPSHDTATSEEAWDAGANEARLPNEGGAETYRKAYAWVDPDADPDTKAAYKFIHHEVSDDGAVGAANLTACSAGIGVLNGGRGGTNIPSSDREGVYAHLAAHLRDADREVPELRARLAGLTYAGHTDYVISELATWRDRTRDLLSKEGRAISSARRDRLAGHISALEDVLRDLRGLMDETAPPAKVLSWALSARARLAQAQAEYNLEEFSNG